MKRFTLILICIILPLLANAQSKGVKCTYTTTFPLSQGFLEIQNDFVRKTLLQRIKEDKKVYSIIQTEDVYLCKKEPESIDKMPLSVDQQEIYMNFNDSSKVTQADHCGKTYLVKGKVEDYQWNISADIDTIQGRTCYKATLRNDDSVTAWFSTDIPVSCAPLGYHGLPGLVIRMELPVYTLDLKSITEADDVTVEVPTKGKTISVKDFTKLVNKEYKDVIETANSVTVIE